MNEQKEGKRNFFVWFLFGGVLPVIVIGVLVVVILLFAGVDVGTWSKEKIASIPGVSMLVSTDNEKELEKQLGAANETIADQEADMSDLQNEVTSLEDNIADLEKDLKKEKKRNTNEVSDTGESNEVEQDDEVKKVAASFRKMDAEKAAKIIENLDETSAIKVLSAVPGEVKGGILAAMDAKVAADLTKAMLKEK